MKCEEAGPWLSALLDDEAPESVREALKRHLGECAACRAKLADWSRWGQATRAWAEQSPQPPLWETVHAALASKAEGMENSREPLAVRSATAVRSVNAKLINMILVAATIALVLLGASWTLSRPPQRMSDEQRLAQTIDRYIETFRKSPDRAQGLLDASFPAAVWEEGAMPTWAADSRVASREQLSGLIRVSMHVRKLPCCECVQGVYRREDGSCVAVFEHEMPMAWTRDADEQEVQCGACVCRLRRLDQRLAASWSEGARSFTVIGLQNDEELRRFVEQLAAP
ncbi:MAG: zf-HC2 domain-containing protein [Pirellulales bacterium]